MLAVSARRHVVRALSFAALVLPGGCRATPTPPPADAGAGEREPSASVGQQADAEGAAPSAAGGASAADSASLAADEAMGRAAQGVEARAARARRDGGTIDPACEGSALSLLGMAIDDRCAASGREASAARSLLDAGGVPAVVLRQEARRDGDRVVVSLVNAGTSPVIVPLKLYPGREDLPAFSVLAEDERHAVFELFPPSAEASPGQARPSAQPTGHVHSARIRLPPRGVASARLTIDPRVAKRLGPPCSDGGACAPVRLPKGRYTLYVGQLVASIDAGPPARVEWDAP